MAQSLSSVRVRIGRLTLNGYTPAQVRRFDGALREHLTSCAQAQPAAAWPAQDGLHVKRIAASTPAAMRPEDAARLLARRLFARVLRPEPERGDV